jgi:hypothetical protein
MKYIKAQRLLLGGLKEVVKESFSFMYGIENIMTLGDPDKIEVNAYRGVSFFIVSIADFGLSLYSEICILKEKT